MKQRCVSYRGISFFPYLQCKFQTCKILLKKCCHSGLLTINITSDISLRNNDVIKAPFTIPNILTFLSSYGKIFLLIGRKTMSQNTLSL